MKTRWLCLFSLWMAQCGISLDLTVFNLGKQRKFPFSRVIFNKSSLFSCLSLAFHHCDDKKIAWLKIFPFISGVLGSKVLESRIPGFKVQWMEHGAFTHNHRHTYCCLLTNLLWSHDSKVAMEFLLWLQSIMDIVTRPACFICD